MRCNNCGWENQPSQARCEKCGSPLKVSVAENREEPVKPLNGTLKGDIPDLPFIDHIDQPESKNINDSDQGDPSFCSNPDCKYPLRAGAQFCPNCKQPVRKQQNNNNNVKPFNGTINPYNDPSGTQLSGFTLRPVAREGETDHPQKDFSGSSVSLNRENLEPSNLTITSKVQAEVIFEDGKWYIVDKSDQKSTFIQVSGKVEIKKGDIIQFGNRRFEFDS